MALEKTDRLFRSGKIDRVRSADELLLERLINTGRLPKHLGLHLQALPPENRDESYLQAVSVAIGIQQGEMPDWAQPNHELPNVLQINNNFAILQELDVQYHTLGALRRTLRGDEEDRAWIARANTVGFMTWSRILRQVHPLTKERLDYLDTFRTQAEADREGIDLKHARRMAVGAMCISDPLLYEMMSNGLVGLRSYVKGIGEIAVLGLGTMLCNDGGHGDLFPYAERLADYVAVHSTPTAATTIDNHNGPKVSYLDDENE